MATLVPQCTTELQDALNVMLPRREGLSDYARLNIQPTTLAKVNELAARYDTRIAVVRAAIAALNAVTDDDYPTLDHEKVTQEVFNDLALQLSTITAAIEQFEAIPEAANAAISSDTPELK